MTRRVAITDRAWPMKEPFAISRGVSTQQRVIIVEIEDEAGRRGRGEACGIPYAGETPETMITALAPVLPAIEAGATREDLLGLLPPGGARCAVDCALWDLEAKASGAPAWARAGLTLFSPVDTCYTIGIRDLDGYERKANELRAFAWLKVKVGQGDPLPAITAVRRGSPQARLVVDPNQAWSPDDLKAYAGPLADLGVAVLEQPIPVGAEAALDGYRCPIALAADELIGDERDLDRARGRFDIVNIKLDKTGGLTTALRLADVAQEHGFALMVGCMAGSSLSMAPAMIIAQRCAVVDLDGPLLQAEDWADGLVYTAGRVAPPAPTFWG
jgi:L-alanine-DL-glutamate epimerase-like enolase superfamily enzyme